MKKAVRVVLATLIFIATSIPAIALAVSSSGDQLVALGMPPALARYIEKSLVLVNSTGNLVLPVATSKKLSVTVNGTEKASVSSTGVVTGAAGLVATAGGVTATAGDITATAGDVVLSASGKTVSLQEATAGDKCMGTLTCNGSSDVVTSTTCATTGSRIFLTRTSLDADTTGDYYVKSISTGVSFTVACETSDTATLNWIIFHEAP